MPPRGRGRGRGGSTRGSGANTGSDNTDSNAMEAGSNLPTASTSQEQAPKRPLNLQNPYFLALNALQRNTIAPPLYPDAKIQKCKPIKKSTFEMIEQLRISRARIRNSPFHVEPSTASLDPKKDPLISALTLRRDFFPVELIVKPSRKKLLSIMRKLGVGDEGDVRQLDKVFKQNEGDDDEDDNVFDEIEQEEENEDDFAFDTVDDDEDYLDEEEVGDDNEGPAM
ncbi:hypothetical protein ABK040_007883 [Willaertia magna]